MALTLEEILKAEGYTDTDLEAVKPFLTDPKLRTAIDKQLGASQAQLQEFRTENEKWADFYDKQYKPTAEERVRLTADKASLEARLKLAEEEGFTKRPEAPNPTAPTPEAAKPWNAKEHNIPTWDDVNTLAQREGEAIALSHDLGADYQRLTGQNILDYTSSDSEGRTLRGMTALLKEAREAKVPLDRYVSKKFDFDAKRAALQAKEKAAYEERIRKEEREKVTSEMMNPNTRALMPSAQPFIPAARQGADGKPVMPWDVPAGERRNSRITRALKSLQGVN